MNNWKFFAGMLLFGSIWGFSEVIIGPMFSRAGLPSGMIMTGFFSLPLMLLSRRLFQKYGIQAGMGAVAGSLRMINPFVGCHLCSAIAIMAQGVLFEIIFYSVTTFDFKNLETWTNKISLGIFSGYTIYVGSYIVTQILTPLSSGHFYVANLIAMMPQFLARGLAVTFIGAITVPAILILKPIKISVKDTWYYPATLGVSACCWMIVIANYMIVTV